MYDNKPTYAPFLCRVRPVGGKRGIHVVRSQGITDQWVQIFIILAY